MKKISTIYTAGVTVALLLVTVHEKIPQRIYHRFKPVPVYVTTPMVASALLVNPINTPHYVDKCTLFQKLSTHNKIVFIGNSITEWCNWNELFTSDKISNRGISGDRSEGILRRIDDYLADKPACILLMDGINDIVQGIPVDTVFTNYKTSIEMAKAKGVPVIVQSTLFVSTTYQTTLTDAQINSSVSNLNNLLANYCKMNLIPYVDINKNLSHNGYLDKKYTSDGIHINGNAYLKWKNVLQPFLQKYL